MQIFVTLATTSGQMWDCQINILYEYESQVSLINTYQIPGNYRTENRLRKMGDYLTVFNKLEYGSAEIGNTYTVFPTHNASVNTTIKPIG